MWLMWNIYNKHEHICQNDNCKIRSLSPQGAMLRLLASFKFLNEISPVKPIWEFFSFFILFQLGCGFFQDFFNGREVVFERKNVLVLYVLFWSLVRWLLALGSAKARGNWATMVYCVTSLLGAYSQHNPINAEIITSTDWQASWKKYNRFFTSLFLKGRRIFQRRQFKHWRWALP